MHPWEFHPMLVHFPIGLLLTAVALDLVGLIRPREILGRTAAGLYIGGVATGLLAGAAGILAWFTAPHSDEAHELMYWHPGVALASMAVFAVVAIRRWKGRAQPARPGLWKLGILGAVLLLVAGALGGHLVYHDGTGIAGLHGAGGHHHGHGDEGGPRPPSAEDVLKDSGHEGHQP